MPRAGGPKSCTTQRSLWLLSRRHNFWPMRPRFQRPHDVFSSTRSTRAFSLKLGRVLCYFCPFCNDGRYSRNHLFQNRSARNCTCLHFLWWDWFALPSKPAYTQIVFFCIMNWEGVIGWRSCGPSKLAVRAHPLITCSTSVSNVANLCYHLNPHERISGLLLEVVRGWKFHVLHHWSYLRSIWCWLHCSVLSLSSLSPPTKLVPLSHHSWATLLQRFMNLLKHVIQSSSSLSGPSGDESLVCSGTWTGSTNVSLYSLQAWCTRGQKVHSGEGNRLRTEQTAFLLRNPKLLVYFCNDVHAQGDQSIHGCSESSFS